MSPDINKDDITYPAAYFLRLIEIYLKTLKANPQRLLMRVGNITLSPVRKPTPGRGIWVRIRSTDQDVLDALAIARKESPLLDKALPPQGSKQKAHSFLITTNYKDN